MTYYDTGTEDETHEEVWHEGRDDHHEALNDRHATVEVEGEEGEVAEARPEFDHPVGDRGTGPGHGEQERHGGQEIGDDVDGDTIVSILALQGEHLHLLDEGWEAADGHEGHEAGHEAAARGTRLDGRVTGAHIVVEGAEAEGHDDVDDDAQPVVVQVPGHVGEGPTRQRAQLLEPARLAAADHLLHHTLLQRLGSHQQDVENMEQAQMLTEFRMQIIWCLQSWLSRVLCS